MKKDTNKYHLATWNGRYACDIIEQGSGSQVRLCEELLVQCLQLDVFIIIAA
jgi:hypothetical protein